MQQNTAESIVQKQLDAYNNRDIETFMTCFSESAQIYRFPNTLKQEGKAAIREIYGNMFNNFPELHSALLNRIVISNKVLDREHVTGFPDNKTLDVVAIYEVEDGLISKVYFVY